MILSDTVSLALRNLGQAKLRTALTTLGVSIGIASLAGMVSLGVGLEEQTVGRFMSSGVFDAITVFPAQAGGRFGAFGGRGAGRGGARGRQGGDTTPDTPRKPLDDDAIAAIAALPDVKEVYPNIRVAVEMQYDQHTGFATLAGVPLSLKQEGAFQTFTAGGFFTDDKSRTCLLTLDLAKRITEKDPKELVGQTVMIAYAAPAAAPPPSGLGTIAGALAGAPARRVTIAFTVAGIVEREPGGPLASLGAGSGLMIPLNQAKAIDAEAIAGRQSLLAPAPAAPAKRPYNSLSVKVARAAATLEVEDKVKALGFSAFSVNDALQGAKRAFIILDIVLSLIGSIALAVSSLGIVNTMVMSILERTREIGIMKAIGGSDADVRGIFLVEASAIGLLGGVCGIALGWAVGRVINFGADIYIRQQGGEAVNLFSLPWWLIGGAIGFSILVSLIAGSYPARRAARLDPIQALRHD
jgi:putative ABC transport system permease protein